MSVFGPRLRAPLQCENTVEDVAQGYPVQEDAPLQTDDIIGRRLCFTWYMNEDKKNKLPAAYRWYTGVVRTHVDRSMYTIDYWDDDTRAMVPYDDAIPLRVSRYRTVFDPDMISTDFQWCLLEEKAADDSDDSSSTSSDDSPIANPDDTDDSRTVTDFRNKMRTLLISKMLEVAPDHKMRCRDLGYEIEVKMYNRLKRYYTELKMDAFMNKYSNWMKELIDKLDDNLVESLCDGEIKTGKMVDIIQRRMTSKMPSKYIN